MVLSSRASLEACRALVIGTGSIGRRHIASLREIRPDVQFALVRDGARQDDYSREIQATLFASLEAAMGWRASIAVIATPSDRHHEAIAPLLRAGIPTLVEKPIITRPEHACQVGELVAALEREHRLPPTQTGCVLRFLPAVRTLKRWLNEGRCGNIVRATFEAGQYLPDWRPAQDYRESYSADAERGGGVIFDLVHELDLTVFLFGDMRLLHAAQTRASDLELSCEDGAQITLRAPGGALIAVSLDYVSRCPVRRIDVVGDMATARLDLVQRTLVLTGPQGTLAQEMDGFDLGPAYRAEVQELLDASHTGAATSLPISEGLRATRLAIAARAMASHDPTWCVPA